MPTKGYIWTGQETCHDTQGNPIDCRGSGQDAEYRLGVQLPANRFIPDGPIVTDTLTSLVWTRDANPAAFPMSWDEAFAHVRTMNDKQAFGYSDWRVPNRRELRSLMSHQTRKPALPAGHHFENVFLGWYWTSTTAAINTSYAWYIHLEGARMFYGHKKQFFLLWPVRSAGSGILPRTGQTICHDSEGEAVECERAGQDASLLNGAEWPVPRFLPEGSDVLDRLTGLIWKGEADLTVGRVIWQQALDAVAALNAEQGGAARWRLPNINELESLVDAGMHSPALPAGNPFESIQDGYWSSTTSIFEPDWAWALYLNKGAVGVGQKWGAHFHVWPVCGP